MKIPGIAMCMVTLGLLGGCAAMDHQPSPGVSERREAALNHIQQSMLEQAPQYSSGCNTVSRGRRASGSSWQSLPSVCESTIDNRPPP